ncbi:hypothetical protein V9T40_002365 [Parthenolecanium corni]|uniref:Uncharacterized protein n=1 Tax=Parthenolecanium corni TaxID=536013 RepID=A0AAN9TG47_9HEMI
MGNKPPRPLDVSQMACSATEGNGGCGVHHDAGHRRCVEVTTKTSTCSSRSSQKASFKWRLLRMCCTIIRTLPTTGSNLYQLRVFLNPNYRKQKSNFNAFNAEVVDLNTAKEEVLLLNQSLSPNGVQYCSITTTSRIEVSVSS